MRSSRQIELVRRPDRVLRSSDLHMVQVELREPHPGEVLVRNAFMSVDPYMRKRMDEGPSYVPAFELGRPLTGAAVGTVVATHDPAFRVGDWVRHELGWRDLALLPARHVRRIDVQRIAPAAYLGALGMPGFTAYVGLLWVAGLQPDDVVFVSGAAGAVGSLVGQIAKLKGNRVIGSAGTSAKVEYLKGELGFDAAFNYREGDVTGLLREAEPQGIDVYFDNVGYDHLEAALEVANRGARFAMCGTVADYDTEVRPPGPTNLFQIVSKRLTLQGFIVSDHAEREGEFQMDMAEWIQSLAVVHRETVVHGLHKSVDALSEMLRGAGTGKMIVAIDS